MSDLDNVSFLEEYVLSDNRLDTTSKAFNEDTEDYWKFSLLYILNKTDDSKDAQTSAFLKKLEKSPFKDSKIIKNLLFRQKLKSFDNASRSELIRDIEEIIGIKTSSLSNSDNNDEKEKEEKKVEIAVNANLNKNVELGIGTKINKRGEIEIDTKSAIKSFLQQADQQFLSLRDLFTANSIDAIIGSPEDLAELKTSEIAGLLEILKDSPPTNVYLLDLIMRDLKENGTKFGDRSIHKKLTVDQMKKLAEMDVTLFSDLSFVLIMAGKLRPISDVFYANNKSYLKAFLDKLRAFVRGPLEHITFKALILYNYLTFYETIAKKDGDDDIAEYQAVVYGNETTKKKLQQKLKFPTYDREILTEYLNLPRNGAVFIDKPCSAKDAKNPAKSVDVTFESELFPELEKIGDDTAFIKRALGYFFLKGDLTAAWEMVRKDWALVVFAKEKLMAQSGTDKFLVNQEKAIKLGESVKRYREFNKISQLRLFETNKAMYKVDEAVTIEYFTKNNPEVTFNIYSLNAKNYYKQNLSEIPSDISLSGVVPLKTITKKYKDKSIIRRTDSITINSLQGKRGIFVIDIIGRSISTRAFIRKGDLRFVYEQTIRGYEFYVFDESYKQIMKPRIIMNGKEYIPLKHNLGDEKENKQKEKENKRKSKLGMIILPYSDKNNNNEDDEQLIIIEDTKSNSSAVLRGFTRKYKEYELLGGFYIDRENLLNKECGKLLIRSNLYLCSEQISLNNANNSYVTIEFKTLDQCVTKNVYNVELNDSKDTEIEFIVPSNLREITCKLNTFINENEKELFIKHAFKINGIDSCPFISDVFILPHPKKGYYLLTVGKNGEIFANEKLNLKLYHKYFKCPVECTIITDHNGLFELGDLENISSVKVYPNNRSFFSEKSFNLLQDYVNCPRRINKKDNTKIYIPWSSKIIPNVHIYDQRFSSDISKVASYSSGYITIGKLPPGDYHVYINDNILNSVQISLHISSGKLFKCDLGDYLLSNSRILQLSQDIPLQITGINNDSNDSNENQIEIQLNGYNKHTRCHIIISSLLPVFTPYQALCAPVRYPDVIDFILERSKYLATTKCDPEFLYILNRNKKNTVKYNGNNLYKPSLLTGKYTPQKEKQNRPIQPKSKIIEHKPTHFKNRYEGVLEESFASALIKSDDTSNIEFLSQPSLNFSNLKPDKNGIIKIPFFKKSDFRVIQIIATDNSNTALLNYLITAGAPIGPNMSINDVRLNNPYDISKHYSPLRKILCLNRDEKYTISNYTSSQYTSFHKLSLLFDLYCGIIGERDIAEFNALNQFRPLVEWNKLTKQSKLEFYDEYMCHEVNLFLYKRDKEFFTETIKPIISSKIRKEFIDLYLLDSDLSHYLNEYIFSRLNVVEQILLCSRYIKNKTLIQATIKSIEETAALIKRNPKTDDKIFESAKYRNRIDLLSKNNFKIAESSKNNADSAKKNDEAESELEFEFNDDDEDDDGNDNDDIFDPFTYDETYEYEESNYFNIPSTQSTTSLIVASKFWKDYALYLLQDGGKGSFLSPYIGRTTTNLNEILLALSVVDLEFESSEPVISRDRNSAKDSVGAILTSPHSSCVIFLSEIVESPLISSTLSVHSNYFDPRDSTEIVHGEQVDKFVVGTFETRRIYGCRSVITNISSVEQEIEVLLQIPEGSISVNSSYKTKSYFLKLLPFMTERLTFYFYFPLPSINGNFKCFPVHCNKNGKTIAYSLDKRLTNIFVVSFGDDKIKNQQSLQNKENWEYITDFNAENTGTGSTNEVLNFVRSNPKTFDVDLSKLGSRLAFDYKFFDKLTLILRERGIYSEAVWKYSLLSDRGGNELCEYLSQQSKFLEYIHPYFESSHFNYDPFDRFDWCLTEFLPLISSRSHTDNQINISNTNIKFINEYAKFLELIAFKSFSKESITICDKLILIQYLINQNRIYESRKLFNSINHSKAKKTVSALIYDYLNLYLSIYDGNIQATQLLLPSCMSYIARPLPNKIKQLWVDLQDLARQVTKPEILNDIFDSDFIKQEENKKNKYINFNIIHDNIKKNNKKIIDISYRNVTECIINYYSVDLELLFSQSPSDSSISTKISLIEPNEFNKISFSSSSSNNNNKYESVDNDKSLNHYFLDLPFKYIGSNCVIQIKSELNPFSECCKPLNDNSFKVQFDKGNQLGECRIVYNDKNNKEFYKKPIPGAYIKVYSFLLGKKENQKYKFFKDGYTDIRGRFNYKNISSNQLENSYKLSIFVKTPINGSNVIDIEL